MFITVLGGRQNVGATIAALNLAKVLENERDILVVDLDLKNPDIGRYLRVKGENTLDDLVCLGEAGLIDKEVIESKTVGVPGAKFKVLCGTGFADKFEYMRYEDIDRVIKKIKECWDLVLCNVCCDLNNAGTVAGVVYADKVAVVVDQNPVIVEDTANKIDTLCKVDGVDRGWFVCVINKYDARLGLGALDIGRRIGVEKCVTLRDMGGWFTGGIAGGSIFITDGLVKSREQKGYIKDLEAMKNVLLG